MAGQHTTELDLCSPTHHHHGQLLVTVTPGHSGRLIHPPPRTEHAQGLGLVLQCATPSSNVSTSVRALQFTAAALDAQAQHLAVGDSRGHVHAFKLKGNRHVRLDRTGSAATCMCFSAGGGHKNLFVGFEVSVSKLQSGRSLPMPLRLVGSW